MFFDLFSPDTYRRKAYNGTRELIDVIKAMKVDWPATWTTKVTHYNNVVSIQDTPIGKDLVVKLPGFTKNDVELTLENNQTVILKAHKAKSEHFGELSFEYSYLVPFKIKEITSKMQDGILVISLVRVEVEPPSVKSEKIDIE